MPSAVLGAFAVVGLLAGSKIHAQYEASHGHGGPIVTPGTDSHITPAGRELGLERAYRPNDYTYYVSTPRGVATVEGNRKPGPGTKLAVIRTDGGLRAVHVGGYSWVTSLVVTIVCALLGALTAFFLVRRLRARIPDRRVDASASVHRDAVLAVIGVLALLVVGGVVAALV